MLAFVLALVLDSDMTAWIVGSFVILLPSAALSHIDHAYIHIGHAMGIKDDDLLFLFKIFYKEYAERLQDKLELVSKPTDSSQSQIGTIDMDGIEMDEISESEQD